ncbi:MAG: pyridoxal phosphate-dependent class II aminotransferase [Deltaproteobacteria bacterium]|nr:pyridoxal phosphate-dependent class II aminotransferase [Deltaproteobacteria bacterium]
MALLYQHGGIPAAAFDRFAMPVRPVMDFSVNTNWMGPPPSIRAQWNGLFSSLDAYPSLHGSAVSDYYLNRYGVPQECILSGNGSAELMYRVALALKPRTAAIVCPSFYHYDRALKSAGTSIRYVAEHVIGDGNDGVTEALCDAVSLCDALILGNPNNPTGRLMNRQSIVDAAKRCPDKWFLVDEAFISFVMNEAASSLLFLRDWPKNLIVFHSLTKFYALPGIRLGAFRASPEMVQKVIGVSPPWMVNSLAEKIAPLLQDAKEYEAQTLTQLRAEVTRLKTRSEGVRHISFTFGAANFATGQWHGSNTLDDLMRPLLARGIFVRDCSNFYGIIPNTFRFAIRSARDNDALFDALNEVACG